MRHLAAVIFFAMCATSQAAWSLLPVTNFVTITGLHVDEFAEALNERYDALKTSTNATYQVTPWVTTHRFRHKTSTNQPDVRTVTATNWDFGIFTNSLWDVPTIKRITPQIYGSIDEQIGKLYPRFLNTSKTNFQNWFNKRASTNWNWGGTNWSITGYGYTSSVPPWTEQTYLSTLENDDTNLFKTIWFGRTATVTQTLDGWAVGVLNQRTVTNEVITSTNFVRNGGIYWNATGTNGSTRILAEIKYEPCGWKSKVHSYPKTVRLSGWLATGGGGVNGVYTHNGNIFERENTSNTNFVNKYLEYESTNSYSVWLNQNWFFTLFFGDDDPWSQLLEWQVIPDSDDPEDTLSNADAWASGYNPVNGFQLNTTGSTFDAAGVLLKSTSMIHEAGYVFKDRGYIHAHPQTWTTPTSGPSYHSTNGPYDSDYFYYPSNYVSARQRIVLGAGTNWSAILPVDYTLTGMYLSGASNNSPEGFYIVTNGIEYSSGTAPGTATLDFVWLDLTYSNSQLGPITHSVNGYILTNELNLVTNDQTHFGDTIYIESAMTGTLWKRIGVDEAEHRVGALTPFLNARQLALNRLTATSNTMIFDGDQTFYTYPAQSNEAATPPDCPWDADDIYQAGASSSSNNNGVISLDLNASARYEYSGGVTDQGGTNCVLLTSGGGWTWSISPGVIAWAATNTGEVEIYGKLKKVTATGGYGITTNTCGGTNEVFDGYRSDVDTVWTDLGGDQYSNILTFTVSPAQIIDENTNYWRGGFGSAWSGIATPATGTDPIVTNAWCSGYWIYSQSSPGDDLSTEATVNEPDWYGVIDWNFDKRD